MAHLSDYNGATLMISGLTPKGGTFPLAEAHDILVGENDKRLDEALTELSENDKRFDEILREISTNGGVVGLTEITYEGLKALRDEGNLAAGTLYRITDYQTTTAQSGTKASNHRFDVVVLALTKNELSEQAYATFHIEKNGQPDGYFATNEGKIADVTAWEIKYCLDNDTSRFAWALDHQRITNLESGFSNGKPLVRQPSFDGQNTYYGKSEFQYAWGTEADVEDSDTVNFIYSKNEYLENGEKVFNSSVQDFNMQIAEVESGKGVIYYLKDEYNNECGYDFKNILFLRDSEWVKEYHENGMFQWVEPDADDNYSDLWLYTFTKLDNGVISDASITSNATYNTIQSRYWLPDNVFVITSINIAYNSIGYDSEHNTIGDSDCELGPLCDHNVIGGESSMKAHSRCSHNKLFGQIGGENSGAEFGTGCAGNTLFAPSTGCKFGDECSGNTLEASEFTELGKNCQNNTLIGASAVTIDNECRYLNLNNVDIGTIGRLCENLTINNAKNLTIEENVTNVSVKAAKPTPLSDTSVFTYDDEYKTLTTEVKGKRVLGIASTAPNRNIINAPLVEQNPSIAFFVPVSSNLNLVPHSPRPGGRYYLIVCDQKADKPLFLNGEKTGYENYYLATTDNIAKAVEVGVVETNGGYHLYILQPDHTIDYVTVMFKGEGLYIRLNHDGDEVETTDIRHPFTKTTISKGLSNQNILVNTLDPSEKIYRSQNTIEILLDD